VLVANPIADSTLGDYCVLKYTSIGTFIWSTYYNSPGNLSDQPNSFAVTNGGEIYVTGIYQINFTNHITTVKFNTNGVLQWARVYNGGGPADGADDIKLDKLGNIIIVGGSAVNNNLAYGLTIKYLPNGDSAWVRKFSPFPRYSHNSKLAIDDSNNIYIAGDYDTNNGDDLILKYNTNGGLIWYTTYDSPQHLGDVGTHIALDSNRNIYVVGTTYIPSSALNNTLVKLNGNGLTQWSRIFTGFLSLPGQCESPGGVIVTRDGNSIYYSTECANAQGNGEIAILKYNSLGDSLWLRRYSQGATGGVPIIGPSLKLDKNNDIYIAGFINLTSTGDDYLTQKYSPAGVLQWSATYNGVLVNSNDHAADIIID